MHCPRKSRILQVMSAIGNLFSGAQSIMSWLTLSAKLIAKSMPAERTHNLDVPGISTVEKGKKTVKEQMTSVIWTTPLGLPVVQPYRRDHRRQVNTVFRNFSQYN
jgi:DNA-directed RNA polymerase, mitochondrial